MTDEIRELTDRERAVLAHMVVDPDAWWTHATNWPKINQEDALAAKVLRWGADYDTAVAQPGYKTRAVRQAEENAELADRVALL